MGIHQRLSNTKRASQDKKAYKKNRMKKQVKRQSTGKERIVGEILDPDLMTIHHLKKRRSCARANITLSGKKKRKLIKRLRREYKANRFVEVKEDDEGNNEDDEKNEDEEMIEEPSDSQNIPKTSTKKVKKGKKKSEKSTKTQEDVEMDSEDDGGG